MKLYTSVQQIIKTQQTIHIRVVIKENKSDLFMDLLEESLKEKEESLKEKEESLKEKEDLKAQLEEKNIYIEQQLKKKIPEEEKYVLKKITISFNNL